MPASEAAANLRRVQGSFTLDEPGTIWIVESGRLDVFLAPLENGLPIGALTHVTRVETGEALFSLAADPRTRLGFIASPASTTDVRICDDGDLPRGELDELLKRWHTGLSAHLRGATPADPADIVLRLFAQRVADDEEEARRLAARKRRDENAVGLALLSLAGARRTDAGGSGALPLVEACESVARAAGIELRIPQSVMRGDARDSLRAIARHSSVRMRKLVLRDEWWKQDSGPMLAFLENGDPVALIPRGACGYDVHDPGKQTRVRMNRVQAATLSGVAWTFYRPLPNRPLNAFSLLQVGLAGCGRDLAVIALAGLCASLVALVGPWATGIVFDSIIPGSERGQLVQTVALIVSSAVAIAMFSLTRSYALLRVEGKLDYATQAAIWDRLLNLPAAFFRDYTAGDLTTRTMGVSQIRATLTGSTITAMLSGIFSLTSFALLFHYSASLALTAAAVVGVAMAVTLACGLIQFRMQRKMADLSGRISGMVFEFVNGIAKLKASGTEGRAFARWALGFAEQKRLAASIRKVSNAAAAFGAAFPIAATGVIFHAAGSGLSTGSFIAFTAAFAQLLASVLGLSTGLLASLNVFPLYSRLKPILAALPETATGQTDPGELKGAIEVSHLSFRYSPAAPLAVNDVSFHIAPGEFVAFAGASGSGKSTLLRLLLGFEKPASGAVYFDGQDLAGLDATELRSQLGAILQNGRLMPGDIFTNIVGSAPLTVNDAWEAARLAGLEEDIKALPMGMYTMVSEGGRGLSGGQRQRLTIARALAAKPRILLVDEATSALDNRTQEIVSQAMERMKVTRIVVAHRLSTIMNADRIFVMDRGSIVQQGTYAELMSQEGFFRELAKRQLA